MRVNICFLARNIEWNIPNLNHLFYDLREYFDIDIICYENDSTDNTVSLLKNIDGIHIESEILGKPVFKSDLNRDRLEFLSEARNKYLNKIKNSDTFKRNPITVVIDSDLRYYNSRRLIKLINMVYLSNFIDAVFANGIDFIGGSGHNVLFAIYYDILPLVMGGKSQNNSIKQPFSSDNFIKVNSAFGGVGVYKTDKFISSKYSTINSKDIFGKNHLLCDHAGLNLRIDGNFYIDPSFIVLR